ncbi:MAG: CoA transferase [Sphingomonadaceae bacterium]|uniref:CaiB/BaiF CoA transferase family protein n=1 Tax=Thermaurantiacus sp. TaxID=2820283 RepID=UPI00298F15FA|nr:CaiB/BaiF CoA-transferase family protein [Thermaurantiacus sp.]MCS6987711.1 CoA transferase [Sphingomonadaceae bacterium]MDW8415070.1 CaiB/BaiF CoA-transferase family protein [Thermaurantiacus sp.]
MAHIAGPLQDLTVLDLSRVLAGPWATQFLGDLGARVIKVERPGAGDDTRGWGPPFVGDGSGDATYYLCANRNREAIAIDFGRPEGAELVRRLAERADVLVENFRTGTLSRYGLDPAQLRARNPRLVTCSITGFGQTGPDAGRAGYDVLIQGVGGLMSLTGRPDGTPGAGPLKAGIPVADLVTGLYAAGTILAALWHVRSAGEGQHIDLALLDCQVAVLANHWASYLNAGVVPGRLGNAHPTVVPYRDFQTADGDVIVAVGSDLQFRRLAEALGRGDLAADPRFTTNAGRCRHREELEAQLEGTLKDWRTAELLEVLDRVGVPAGPIQDLSAVFHHPQVIARALVQRVQRVTGAEVALVGHPARLSRTPAAVRTAPPVRGEHTRAILEGDLGLSPAEIDRLFAEGVVA